LGEALWGFHRHFDIEVTLFARPQDRHALAFQLELFAGLRACRNFDFCGAAVEGTHADFGTKCRLDHGDWNAAGKIRAVTPKERGRPREKKDVKAARGAPLGPGFAFAAKTDSCPVLNAGRNIDG